MTPKVRGGRALALRIQASALHVGIAVAFLAAHTASAQSQNERPVFRSTTAAVTVDVIVRDAKGQAITGLTQDDFEIFEDGVPQRILSVEMRDGQIPRAGVTPERLEPVVGDEGAGQALVAVLFHNLFTQSRVGAIAAARSMVASLAPDEFAGILAMDWRLTPFSEFTRDVPALNRALDKLAKSAASHSLAPEPLGITEINGLQHDASSRGGAEAEAMRGRLADQGMGARHAATQAVGLEDAIAWLGQYPGRKSIILFSEGVAVSPQTESVITRALVENVTVYTIAAGGLSATGRFALPDRSVDSRELNGSSRRGNESWRTGILEMDRTSGLRPLAAATGGFMISDTNDLTAALASINADRRVYYVLGYSSSNAPLDGTTRQIEVRVKREKVSVRARSEYVAAKP